MDTFALYQEVQAVVQGFLKAHFFRAGKYGIDCSLGLGLQLGAGEGLGYCGYFLRCDEQRLKLISIFGITSEALFY